MEEKKTEIPQENNTYGSVITEIAGIIHIDENYDYKSDYTSYLEQKNE
ncbi:MAG: hypothetical protein J6X78_09885 [Treponema sp.]|nr:hypothetical protein [Treponema sp.]